MKMTAKVYIIEIGMFEMISLSLCPTLLDGVGFTLPFIHCNFHLRNEGIRGWSNVSALY